MSTAPAKHVVVTGAASGIGLACVESLLAEGHRVCGMDLQPFPIDQIPTEHRSRFIEARANVTNQAECVAATKHAVEAFGKINGLIHMAGIHSSLTWREITAEHMDRILSVNVTGAFLITQAVAEQMERGGAIVLTSSSSITVGGTGGSGRGGPAYVASKAAIIGLTRALARSLAPLGIRVNAVGPGSTETAMTAEYDEQAKRRVGERVMVGRMGRPEEIAAVACFLISDGASYVTGEILPVTGGI
jgi:NAD(P)-dependent dehydrogenase (short-subunit alcohol dehydrogenase family)